ncbi:MAG: LptA/OstA family protein [Thermoanaerobaculia bacterium]|nr:LptA/OstA family protein [Thermoanaerobaculia bacterium]
MSEPTRRIRLAKRIALVVSLLTVAAVVALYLLGRRTRLQEPEPVEEPVETIGSDETSRQVGEGFDHTLMEEDTPLFRIQAGRSRRTRGGRFFLDEVDLTIYRVRGGELRVRADEATYDLEAETARLTGDVRLEGPEGFSLETEELQVVAKGDVVQTDGPLHFTYGGRRPLQGEADWFRAHLARDVFILRDDVHLWNQADAEKSFSLRAPRVLLNRGENTARAVAGVTAEWGESRVTARKINAQLDPASHELHFLRAVTDVRARIRSGTTANGGYRTIVMEGSRMGILFDASGQPEKIELEDLEDDRSEVRATGAEGESFELVAAYVEGLFRAGNLARAQAVEKVILTQILTPGSKERDEGGEGEEDTGKVQENGDREIVRRTATGARMEAEFGPEGSYRYVQLEGGVRIEEGATILEGETARILPGRLETRGEPAHWTSGEGELWAPAIAFDRKTSLAHAQDGVRAVVEEQPGSDTGPFAGTPMGEGGEPIRVEAREAFFREEPRSFLFRGDVRAWSGDQVLLTEQLRGDQDPQRLSAAQGVETQWVLEPEESDEGDEGAEAEETTRRIRVNARTMIYDPGEKTIQYRTRVTVVEPGRRLTCEKLTVHLDAEGELERMICEEEVVLETEEEGRRIQADRAEYDLSLREARFFGRPVEMTNDRGSQIEGKVLVYSLEEETVRLSGGEDDQGPPEAGPEPDDRETPDR